MKVMEIQSIKRLSLTHCPLVPLGKGHKSAKNIAPAIQITPPGAALQGREAVNERRQLSAEAAEAGAEVMCGALTLALQFPQLMCCWQNSGIAFFSANWEL